MGVTRKPLAFEGKFVQIPNEWVRDARLSRRSRGLLAEIMSHRIGWHISIGSLQTAGIEGRDAIRASLAELLAAGYLTRAQTRGEAGRFNEVEYDLTEPRTADGKAVSGGFTGSGSPDDGSAAHGESDTKNTISKEDHLSEHIPTVITSTDGEQQIKSPYSELFLTWYSSYPRKESKGDAFKAWEVLRKAHHLPALDQLLHATAQYTRTVAGKEAQFVKLPAGWLRDRKWEDEATATIPAPVRNVRKFVAHKDEVA